MNASTLFTSHTLVDTLGRKLTLEAWVSQDLFGTTSQLICRRDGKIYHKGKPVSHANIVAAQASIPKRFAKGIAYWSKGAKMVYTYPSQRRKSA